MLWGVITAVFVLFNVLPADPAKMFLGQQQDKEQLEIIRKKYGFDKPLFTQYLYYLNDIALVSFHAKNKNHYTFCDENKYTFLYKINFKNYVITFKIPYLGTSFQKNGKKVSSILAQTLPNTIILAMSSMSIAFFLGVILGILAAIYQGKWIDKCIMIFSTLGMSIPSFLSAILCSWIFGFLLKAYTNLNMTGSLYEVDDFGTGVYIQWKNLILPSLVLGIRPLAVVSQLMRNALLQVLSENYITMARAKGLSFFQIIKNHALKNALNPVITTVSGWFASLLAGAVFVEYIFNWNGIGKQIVDALENLDQPVLMGAVLVIGMSFILINILVDWVYKWLDPRVSL